MLWKLCTWCLLRGRRVSVSIDGTVVNLHLVSAPFLYCNFIFVSVSRNLALLTLCNVSNVLSLNGLNTVMKKINYIAVNLHLSTAYLMIVESNKILQRNVFSAFFYFRAVLFLWWFVYRIV